MKFNGITKKGREYLAKIQAENKPVNFSKIKIGDGRLDNYDNPAELEHLINQKVEKGILTLNQEHDTVILTTNIDNVSLRTGYYPREIGVFVNDNGQELMYYYMNDGDETSWIPPETDGPFKIELKLNLIASNAQSITVPNSGKDLYITKEYLEDNYTQNGGYKGTAMALKKLYDELSRKINALNFCPYNIGDIYVTTKTEDPSTIWQGTKWQKIENRFLKGTSSNEETAMLGGSNTKALTVDDLPPHSHDITINEDGSHTHTQTSHSHTQVAHKHISENGQLYNNKRYGSYHQNNTTLSTFDDTNDGDYYEEVRISTNAAGGENTGTATPIIYTAGDHTHKATISETGSGKELDIRPAYYTVNMWLRTE